MLRIGHPIGFQNSHAKLLLDVRHGLWRQRRAARTDEAQMFGSRWSGRRFGPRQQYLMNRRHGGVPTDTMVPDGGPERERVEARRYDDRSTREQCSQR